MKTDHFTKPLRCGYTFLIGLLFATHLITAQTTFQKIYTAPVESRGISVLEISDGYLLNCLTQTSPDNIDPLLIKIDFAGNVVWQKTYGGFFDEEFYNIANANDGGYIAIGTTRSFNGSNYNYDAWVVKLDNDGNMLWQQSAGTLDKAEVYSGTIIPQSDGYIISGAQSYPGTIRTTIIRIDNAGNTLWSKMRMVDEYDFTDAGLLSNNQLYIAGSAGNQAFFGITDPATGNFLQSKRYKPVLDTVIETGSLSFFNAVAPANDGNLAVAGSVRPEIPGLSHSEGLIAKITPAGQVLWSKEYSDGMHNIYSVNFLKASDNGYIASIPSYLFTGDNARIFKIDDNGNVVWTRLYGSDKSDGFSRIIGTSDGGYMALGHTVNDAGNNDIFLVKMNSEGLVDGCCSPGFHISVRDYPLTVADEPASVVDFVPVSPIGFTSGTDAVVSGLPFCGNLKETVTDTILFNPGDTVFVNGVAYDFPATVLDTLPAVVSSCDTIVITTLLFTPAWYADHDGDGYGDDNQSVNALTPPAGYVADGGDCDDNNDLIHPGAIENCSNGIDDDCDGFTDNDTQSPTVLCQPAFTLQLGADGTAFLQAEAVDNGSFDNCSTPQLLLNQYEFFCSDLGTFDISVIGIDDAGNYNFCTTKLTVADQLPPMVTPPADTIPVYFSETGTATLLLTNVATATDNCSLNQWSFAVNAPQNFTNGALVTLESPQYLPGNIVTVWVRANDVSGNTGQPVPVYLELRDTFPPKAYCNSPIVAPDVTGTATLTLEDIAFLKTDNTDSCYWSPFPTLTFTCSDVITTLNITLQVTDLAGNTAACTALILVADTADADGDGVNNCADDCPDNPSLTTAPAWYVDGDMDGYGAGAAVYSCVPPPGAASNADDCNDQNPAIHPGATEVLNGLDDDCDGLIDEGLVSTTDIANGNLHIFPNPANNRVTITWPAGLLTDEVICTLTDITGRVVQITPVAGATSQSLELDITAIPSGAYILRMLDCQQRVVTGKLVRM